MIRFSAVLVAVAVGVLIGGAATSKLLLVYLAIAVSAVALVVLIIGTLLKRNEIFGTAQGPASAPAGAGPGAAVMTQPVPIGAPAPPPPFAAAAFGYGTAHQGPNPTAPTPASAPAAAAGTQHVGIAPVHGGQQETAGEPASWVSPAPWSAAASGWIPATREERVPTTSEPPAAQSWFDRLGSPATPGAAADDQSPAPAAGWAWSRSNGNPAAPPEAASPGDAGSTSTVDAEDDWPGRYSWLSDEADSEDGTAEGAGTGQPVEAVTATRAEKIITVADTAEPDAPVGTAAEPEVPATDAPASDAPKPDTVKPDTVKAQAPEPDNPEQDAPATGADGAVPVPEPTAVEQVPAAGPESGTPTVTEPPAGDAEPQPGTADAAAADAARDTRDNGATAGGAEAVADDDGAAEAPADEAGAVDDSLVSVVRGVPRYHKQDCILIRFMPDGDVQRMPVAEAADAGCTPCAACQPQH